MFFSGTLLTNPKNFQLTLTPGQQLERSVRSIFGLSKKSEDEFISVQTRSEKSAGGSRKERSCRKINEATNLGNNSSQFFCFTSLSGTKLAIPGPEYNKHFFRAQARGANLGSIDFRLFSLSIVAP